MLPSRCVPIEPTLAAEPQTWKLAIHIAVDEERAGAITVHVPVTEIINGVGLGLDLLFHDEEARGPLRVSKVNLS